MRATSFRLVSHFFFSKTEPHKGLCYMGDPRWRVRSWRRSSLSPHSSYYGGLCGPPANSLSYTLTALDSVTHLGNAWKQEPRPGTHLCPLNMESRRRLDQTRHASTPSPSSGGARITRKRGGFLPSTKPEGPYLHPSETRRIIETHLYLKKNNLRLKLFE